MEMKKKRGRGVSMRHAVFGQSKKIFAQKFRIVCNEARLDLFPTPLLPSHLSIYDEYYMLSPPSVSLSLYTTGSESTQTQMFFLDYKAADSA